MNTLTPKQLRQDFPFLNTGVAYLDNASTSQKPQVVLDAMNGYYSDYCANVHRGIYEMSERATEAYENVRSQVAAFIGADHSEEIIFTSGTTQSLNLAARLVSQNLQAGDEVVVSRIEHHSQLVPWQIIAKEKGLKLKFLELTSEETIDPAQFKSLITPRTKMLAINHVSNVSGYIVPLKELITIAHTHNMLVIVDAAQSVPHMPVNVQELDADFLAFSAHKLCGPTGVGVLYGKQDLLERYDPVFGGGSMISTVDSEYFTHADLPLKFEPGTPNVAGVIGFGAALTYLTSIGMEKIQRATHDVYTYAYEQLRTLPEIKKIYGPIDPSVRSSIIAFNVHETHPHDLAAILDADHQVAVRAGHHCAQPLATYWKVPATVRASFYFYNTKEDVDRLVTGIQKAQAIFRT